MFREKSFSEAHKEAKDEGREKGKNVSVQFVLRRHEDPGKLPDGMSADFITEQGIANAKETGGDLAYEATYLMVTGSKGVNRARETGGYILGSFRDEAGAEAIVNKEMSAEAQEKAGHGKMPPGDVVIYRSGDLDPVKNFAKVMKEAKGAGAKDLTEVIQFWMDNPDKAKEAGALTSEEVAAELAHRLSIGIKMSDRLYEETDLRAENLTHGPKPDALLKEVILQKDGTRGFKKLEEIGGAFNAGEEVVFDINRDSDGELSLKIKFRGEEYDVDMNRLDELQDLYKKMQEEKREKSKV